MTVQWVVVVTTCRQVFEQLVTTSTSRACTGQSPWQQLNAN